jgi:hypothetical protein
MNTVLRIVVEQMRDFPVFLFFLRFVFFAILGGEIEYTHFYWNRN